ncbi:MAG: hypothetical protein ACYDCF_11225, partial [Burkholderiales bacterium]
LAENGGLFEAEVRTHHLNWREHEYLAAVRRRQQETENRARIARLTAELEGNRAHIAALTAALEGNRAHIAALTAALEGNKAHIAALTAALEGNKAHIAALTEELAALRASRSWRLTAPLRHLADLARRLRQRH